MFGAFFIGLGSRPHFIGIDPPSPLQLPASFMLARGHSADNVCVACWQTGKRGNDMADKRAKRTSQQTEQLASSGVVKITVRLDELVAKRLGVESVMTGESQSDIANRVLGAYLSGWRLPSKVGGVVAPAENTENAA